jgi:hypothetical protein
VPSQPPIQWVPGALSLGIKRPGREDDHSPPSSAEVKEYGFIAWCSAKAHGQLYLYLYTELFSFSIKIRETTKMIILLPKTLLFPNVL